MLPVEKEYYFKLKLVHLLLVSSTKRWRKNSNISDNSELSLAIISFLLCMLVTLEIQTEYLLVYVACVLQLSRHRTELQYPRVVSGGGY